MSAEEEIRQLLARYAGVHDRLDLDGLLALFTADGRYCSRGVEHSGQATLRTFMASVYARRPANHRMKHLYINPVIRVDGDAARATCDFVAFERTGDGPWEINSIGQCLDTLVRHHAQPGVWLIAERRIQPIV